MLTKENIEKWKNIRSNVPRRWHSEWEPEEKRDPLKILRKQNEDRIKELIPLRYERMSISPFTFFRGAAAIMAYDLSKTPVTGLDVQLCGDAHIANFGLFASPERNLVFDINDFDETIFGPWEWDVKRLAASIMVAGRTIGYSEKQSQEFTHAAVIAYKEAMHEFSLMNTLDLWYTRTDVSKVSDSIKNEKMKTRLSKIVEKAQGHTSMKAMEKLTHVVNGKRKFIEDPPIIQHVFSQEDVDFIHEGIVSYRKTLSNEKRLILDRFDTVDVARKVVGIGSVGTPCFVVLLQGKDTGDPLLLQVKESSNSVLSPYIKKNGFTNNGHRVVAGQRLIQTTSDIFLGWGKLNDKDFYVRQLWDMKGSLPLDQLRPVGFERYVKGCGKILARSHANTGNRFAIATYIGNSYKFTGAVVKFAVKYADQTAKDHAKLVKAMKNGLLDK